MNYRNYGVVLILMLSIYSCQVEKTERVSSDLNFDHFVIWVSNPKKAKESLTKIGFTSVPDSLSAVHHGQGTAGRYFNFLNGYLELIFVRDQKELEENNLQHKDLDFVKRANFEKNGASPFGIALKLKNYDTTKIPFQEIEYHQDWMDEDANIYAAKNSNIYLNEPSIFVVYPKIEADTFESLSDLDNIPEEYAIWRSFFIHPNGAQKITNIRITSIDLNLDSETIRTVNSIQNLSVEDGQDYLMELHFDNDIQGKSFDLRPELPLLIYL